MARRKNKEPPIVAVVVVTHGRAAGALVVSARSLIGKIPALAAVSVKPGEASARIIDRVSAACDAVDEGAGVLILVDLHGSTPFHACMSMLDGTRPAEVLCGVNLPMLLKMTTMDRRSGSPAGLAEELRDVGRRSIRLGSELTGRTILEESF